MDYITTDSRNVISRKSRITGSKYIVLAGKSLIESNVVLRGDRSQDGKPILALGQFCILRQNCKLDPPQRELQDDSQQETHNKTRFYPQKIASCVYIGKNTVVRAASIDSHVIIGDNCEIGMFAVIKSCVVIPDHTKIPPFAVISTDQDLPESAKEVIEEFCRQVHAGVDVPMPFARIPK